MMMHQVATVRHRPTYPGKVEFRPCLTVRSEVQRPQAQVDVNCRVRLERAVGWLRFGLHKSRMSRGNDT